MESRPEFTHPICKAVFQAEYSSGESISISIYDSCIFQYKTIRPELLRTIQYQSGKPS